MSSLLPHSFRPRRPTQPVLHLRATGGGLVRQAWLDRQRGIEGYVLTTCLIELLLYEAKCPTQVGPSKDGTFEIRPEEVGTFEMRLDEISTFEMRPEEVGTFNVRPD